MSESADNKSSDDALERPAKLQSFAELADAEDIPREALPRVEALIRDSSWVAEWFSRALLVYGLTLIVVGVVFFFGFNWEKVPELAKLGLVQIGFAGALAAGTVRDLHSVTSRIFLVVAGALIGVFLAVFGQVYQTSADAWELFAIWAAMLLPLALLAGTQGAWVLFGSIAATAGVIGLDQGWTQRAWGWQMLRQFSVIFAASALVLCVTEWLRSHGAGLVEEFPWSRPLLLTTGVGALAVPVCVLNSETHDSITLVLAAAMLIISSVAAVWYYVERKPVIAAPVIVGLSWLVVVVRFVVEYTFDFFDDRILAFAGLAIVTTGLTAGLVAVLTRVHRYINEHQNPGEADVEEAS